MAIAIDTDKAIQALTGVGFKPEQARVLIDQLVPATNELVTKELFRAELTALEARMAARIYGSQIAAVVAVVGTLKFFGVF